VTCSAREILPANYASADIALRILRTYYPTFGKEALGRRFNDAFVQIIISGKV